ncbi:unnamed protein product [Cuscuta campestris]|uniref:Uncharacterized protein n=1 Tax=Cuscuta campestris TaxID=132261 RepID=A0A484MF80_9ASTE|nr:unnamed protein product [Cuscuta campestris]
MAGGRRDYPGWNPPPRQSSAPLSFAARGGPLVPEEGKIVGSTRAVGKRKLVKGRAAAKGKIVKSRAAGKGKSVKSGRVRFR